ncbi:MAG: metal-dependent hydrolase [Flavobacteriales bacterium]|jgi:inner membrane protein|nr:metal-dependent hydrolase [Flavobacteriales bacterium]
MASIFSHIIAAGALGTVRYPKKEVFKYFALGVFCASFPDIDILAFKLGIPYEHPFGHRGAFHSLLFAYLQGLFIVRIFYSNLAFMTRASLTIGFYFFCCGVSHSLLDAMTNGGLGVAFFAPFDNTRYFLPWRPIEVSPIEMDSFFGEWGVRVLKSELQYVVLPSILLVLGSFGVRRLKNG